MKKLLVIAAIASSAVISLAAQAAPASSTISGVQSQVSGDAVKVYHCRGWSGGWHCGGGGWGHGRYWSHRRYGSRHY
jgi:Spy/CpxP family protein refolding chaperone